MYQENSVDTGLSNNGVIKDVLLFVIAGFSTGVATVLILGLLILLTTPAVNADDLQPVRCGPRTTHGYSNAPMLVIIKMVMAGLS